MTTKFRGGMGELMRQASRLQRKVERRKEELKTETVEASAGNDRSRSSPTAAARSSASRSTRRCCRRKSSRWCRT